jgi:heat shock protein HtpX
MNQLKTVALLGLLSAMLVIISYLLIGGLTGAIVGFVLAAIMNFSSWFFSDRIALSAYQAQPLSEAEAPKIYQMVKRLCVRSRLPMPRIYIVPSNAANAFATGRDPHHAAIALTQGIINLLPDNELEGVIAHELSHINYRDTLTQAVAATIAAAISAIAQYASYGMMFGMGNRQRRPANQLGTILAIVLAPAAAMVIQFSISRTREFEADAGAARMTGKPRALARALQRLEGSAKQQPLEANPAFEPLLITNAPPKNIFSNLFSTHPDTRERIQRLLQLEREMDRQSIKTNLPESSL